MDQTCPNCGITNRVTARFCQNCASPLQSDPTLFGPATGLLTPQSMLSSRYIILRKVGEGGMAAVYQVTDARISGKVWAIKEMSDAAITNPLDRQEATDAFRREAEVLSNLTHPNIPRVTDFFSESGKQYLVMEFVEGETVEDILERQKRPLAEAKVRSWAEQICDVLAYLHAQNPPVIFRDLKPSNIMVDQAGSVKLIDFGIVRFFQPGKTKDTIAFGTTGYAPPEQYGKGQTDGRSDIYALGATLHHLLTNHDPALTPFQFKPVRTFNPKVSATMEAVVMRALEQDPTRRWPNAKEMRQAMAGIELPAVQSPRVPAPVPIPTPPPVTRSPVSPLPRGVEFAGFGQRFLAYFVDSIFLTIIYTVCSCPLQVMATELDPDVQEIAALLLCGWLAIFLLFAGWYYIFLPARSGQTWGKKMAGIKIIATNGDSPGAGRCFGRFFGYFISGMIFYIGFLMPLWTEKKQALHDIMAGTYVVKT